MISVKNILKKALKDRLITVKEWNDGIYVYAICRIVWETKYHAILHVVESEEDAKEIIKEHNDPNYFYQKIRIN